MKLKGLLILCCILMSSISILAQSATSAADPTTGTWKGYIAETMPAQQTGNANVAADLHKNFSEVADWISKAADMVPAEKYNYKPVDTVRSFGQIMAHVADAANFFCARGVGENVKYSDAIEKGGTDKATLVPKLKQAFEKCEAAYSSSNAQFAPLISNLGHTSLHYGNIITYMRLLGMKPPSS